jgi:hypothetical protein
VWCSSQYQYRCNLGSILPYGYALLTVSCVVPTSTWEGGGARAAASMAWWLAVDLRETRGCTLEGPTCVGHRWIPVRSPRLEPCSPHRQIPHRRTPSPSLADRRVQRRRGSMAARRGQTTATDRECERENRWRCADVDVGKGRQRGGGRRRRDR